MKKTFEVGMYVPDAKSRELKQVMLDYAKLKGLKCRFIRSIVYRDSIFVCFSENGIDFCAPDWSRKTTPITIAQFFEYCDNWKECQVDPAWIPVSVKPESYVDLIVRVQTNEGFKSWCGSYFFGRFGYYTPGRGFIESDDITNYQHLPKP